MSQITYYLELIANKREAILQKSKEISKCKEKIADVREDRKKKTAELMRQIGSTKDTSRKASLRQQKANLSTRCANEISRHTAEIDRFKTAKEKLTKEAAAYREKLANARKAEKKK